MTKGALRPALCLGTAVFSACLVSIDEGKKVRGEGDAQGAVDAISDATGGDAADEQDTADERPLAFPPDAAIFGGHGYLVRCADAVSWSTAYSEALGLGGHLVTLTSENERIKMMSLVGAAGCAAGRGAWIGLRQNAATKVEPAGGWEWVTGEAPTLIPWAPNEPNNAGPEDFGVFRGDGSLEDEPDDGRKAVNSYVIEFEGG